MARWWTSNLEIQALTTTNTTTTTPNSMVALDQATNDELAVTDKDSLEKVHDLSSDIPTKNSNRSVAIFYNIYISPNGTGSTLQIINEQLKFRRYSHLFKAMLYYTRIGRLDVPMPDCQPCESLGEYEEGHEIITLQSLYRYCQHHPQDMVVYIHDKGSNNMNKYNHNLRRTLTKAVFDSECTTTGSFSSSCDICSARFQAIPFPSFTGNMFTAKCSYVNTLLSPQEYQEAKLRLAELVWYNENNTEAYLMVASRMEWQLKRDSWMGLSRYSNEHWIAGHPHVKPCDVYGGDWKGSYTGAPASTTWIAEQRPAPRFNATEMGVKGLHPWFSEEGRLFEWEFIYNATPSVPDSWVNGSYESFWNTTLGRRAGKRRPMKVKYPEA